MFREDLEAAGLLRRVKKDEDDTEGTLPLVDASGRRIDFYCLKHFALSLQARGGTPERILRALAGHKSRVAIEN